MGLKGLSMGLKGLSMALKGLSMVLKGLSMLPKGLSISFRTGYIRIKAQPSILLPFPGFTKSFMD